MVNHEEINQEIMGAAMAVWNELKPGLEVEAVVLLKFREAELTWNKLLTTDGTDFTEGEG